MGSVAADSYYVVHDRLGVGGMGVVHRGTMVTRAGERLVAIKRLSDNLAGDEAARTRLMSEGRLVFQLTHANICQVFDLAIDNDSLFVVMEYIDGVDLFTLVSLLSRKGAELRTSHAVYIAREVARALDYAYRRRDGNGRRMFLCHGDVSPRNILLSRAGEVKLADFGIARGLGLSSPGAGLQGGTRGFSAPEVGRMAPSLQSDIYSLGATLHFAIAGAGLKCASAGGSGRVPDDNRLHVIESRGGEQLRRIVSRAIAVDPGDRFDSMRELERELARLLAREFPDFTPSELADDVERLKEPPAPVPVTDSGTVLSSLTAIDTGTTEDLRVGRASGEASTQTASRPRRRHWRYWLIALTIAISGVVAFWGRMALSVDAEQEDSDVDVARAGAPDDDTAASVAATEAGEADAARQQLADAGARAAQASDTGPDRKEPRRPPRGAVRSSRAEPRAPGKLTVLARPWGRVYVDGKLIAEETPVVNVDIAPGVHRVRLFYPSLAKYSGTRRIEVRPEQTVSLSFDH